MDLGEFSQQIAAPDWGLWEQEVPGSNPGAPIELTGIGGVRCSPIRCRFLRNPSQHLDQRRSVGLHHLRAQTLPAESYNCQRAARRV